jgi:RND superfamily putative drug exporter
MIVLLTWIIVATAGFFSTQDLNSRLTTSLSVPGSESAKAESILNQGFGESSESLITITYRFGTLPKSDIEALMKKVESAITQVPQLSIIQQRAIAGTLFTIVTSDKDLTTASEYVHPLRQSLKSNKLGTALVTGPPAIYKDVQPLLDKDLQRGQLIAIFSAFILLVLILGFSFAIFLPLILAVSSIAVTLGALDLLSRHFLMVLYIPSVVELIGFGLAIDYSLLILHRFRSESKRNPTSSNPELISLTMQTAGRTVLTSSLTITLALSTLLLVPVPFIRSLGMAGALVPIFSALASLTLLPALLALFGKYAAKSYRFAGLLDRSGRDGSLIARLTSLITRKPKHIFLATLAVLLLFAAPILTLQVTPSSLSALPAEIESAQGISYVTSRIGEGVITPIVIMADLKTVGASNDAAVANARLDLAITLSEVPGISSVAQGSLPPYIDPTGRYLRLFVFSESALGASETTNLVKIIRSQHLPNSDLAKYANFYVGGAPGQGVDLVAKIMKYLPFIAFGLLLAIYFVLLKAFNSVVLPLKAIALDFISLAASLGLLVLFMKYGLGKALFGTYQLDQIEIWVLVFLVAILFGLSMDYEIFIVARAREAWERGESNTAAISEALTRTLGVVTAAAIIFIGAVSGFIFGHFAGLQELGLGLTLAVLIDATLIRALLLPSAMVLLGEWNWVSPKKLLHDVDREVKCRDLITKC